MSWKCPGCGVVYKEFIIKSIEKEKCGCGYNIHFETSKKRLKRFKWDKPETGIKLKN